MIKCGVMNNFTHLSPSDYKEVPMQRPPGHLHPLPAILSLLALVLTLAACGGSSNNVPDTHQLITQAQAAIQKVQSYHFNLAVDNPGTGAALIIKTADAEAQVP